MVNKKSLATFVRTVGNQVIAGFKHFLNNVKISGDLVHDPDPLGSTATNLLTVDAQGVVRKATSLAGATGTVTSVALTAPSAFTVTGSPITTSGTIAIGGAGTASQYIRGDGSLETFPSLTGFVPYTGATANVDLGTHTLLAKDLVINHPSGSGIAASITKNGSGAALSIIKDGSGEGLTVVKGSGAGNAASITGGVTLISELHLTTALADSYIASSANWNAAYNDKINSAAVTGTTTKTLTLTQQDGGTITASWTDINTDAVTSVFGRTGAVIAVSGDYNTSQVTENTNLYFTNARARTAISLTTTGTSGAATYDNATGVLNVPQYQSVITNPVTGTGTTNYVTKWTSSSNIGDSQIFDNGTNVGIGTASPTEKLHVAGNGLFTGGVYVNNTSAYLWNTTNGVIRFGTNNTERARITAAGNVGIGTTAPAGKLHVQDTNGGVFFDGSGATYNRFKSTTSSASVGRDLLFSTQNSGTTPDLYITSAGNVGIGTTSPVTKLNLKESNTGTEGLIITNWNNVNTLFLGSDSSSGGGKITLKTNAGTSNVFISSYSDSYLNGGNVGIGTTSPTEKLHVTNSLLVGTTVGSNVVARFSTLSSGKDSTLLLSDGVSYSSKISMLSGDLHLSTEGKISAVTVKATTGNVGIGTTSPSDTLDLYQAANTTAIRLTSAGVGSKIYRLTSQLIGVSNAGFGIQNATDGRYELAIDGSGNVGIGTTSPGAKLTIKGTTNGYGSGIRWDNVSTANNFEAIHGSSNTLYWGYNGTTFLQMVGSSNLNFVGSGNVGIGTTSPGAKLEVVGDTYLRTQVFTDTIRPYTGNQLQLLNGGSNTLFINGNVGIGTTSPAAGLQVAKGGTTIPVAGSSTASAVFGNSTSDDNYGVAIGANSSGVGYISSQRTDGNATTYNLAIQPNGGNVGIGTTSPSQKLHVNGNITLTNNADKILFGSGGASPSWSAPQIARMSSTLTMSDYSGVQFGGYDGTSYGPRMTVLGTGNVGIGTTSPSAKLHVIGNVTVSATLLTANVKLTGTLTDSFNQVGTSGQVLSSTGTGTEWITGGGGGGSTIIVQDESTTIGSSFTTLNFIGDNVNATASGSTAVIEVTGRASSGSVYYDDVATPFVIPGGGFADVEINNQTVMATVPSSLTGSNKLMATITFGVSNVSSYEAFNGFKFRLYNSGPMSDVQGTTHSWNGYMSKDEGCTTTVFTFHIPIDPSVVAGGDDIRVQADALTNYTPEIYYCALTLMEGTN